MKLWYTFVVNTQKGFSTLLGLLLVLVVVGGGSYFYIKNINTSSNTSSSENIGEEKQDKNEDEEGVIDNKLSVKVLSPNGGETYTVGEYVLIKWETKNIGNKKISIDLLTSSGTLVYNLGSAVDPKTGTQLDSSGPAYSWHLPTLSSPGGRRLDPGAYKILITVEGESEVSDLSDTFFTVVSDVKRSDIMPSSWIQETIDLGLNKRLTFWTPSQYKDHISSRVINKKIDYQPEDFGLQTIGGSVSDKKEIQIINGTAISYFFVTATNYKWNMVEIPLSNKSHVEIGVSYKNPNDAISNEDWNKIVSTFEIK
ncbi:MAG: hypothetical protein RL150_461 [Candidatus Parcubacteria bacterium]|jgi:hypothetical protein